MFKKTTLTSDELVIIIDEVINGKTMYRAAKDRQVSPNNLYPMMRGARAYERYLVERKLLKAPVLPTLEQ